MKTNSNVRQQHHQQKSHSIVSSPSPNNCKKRRTNTDTTIASIAPYVIQWLEKRKKTIPEALKSDVSGGTSFTDINCVMRLLPSLRERERRALVRHVDKCINGDDETKVVELEGSDGEYDIHDNLQHNNIQNSSWPANVQFSNNYHWHPTVPQETKDKYCPQNRRQRTPRLSNKVYFKRITDPNHPAHREFGLFCAIPHAPPGTWLLDYVGRITLGEDQDKQSGKDSDFGPIPPIYLTWLTCGALRLCFRFWGTE